MPSRLEKTCQELEALINFTVESVEESPVLQELGGKCNAISRYYRGLGICELLLEADGDAFNHQLIRSAQTRKYYLRRCRDEKFFDDPAQRAGIVGPFLDALASHQPKLAQEIALLSPQKWWESDEYEDDFLYAHFLHQLVLGGREDEASRTLEAFKSVLEGALSERLEVCTALFTRGQGEFDRAFEELLEAQVRFIRAEKRTFRAEDVCFLPESRIFVEGLALLELAGLRGLRTQEEYPPLCPSLARLPFESPFDPGYFPGLPL